MRYFIWTFWPLPDAIPPLHGNGLYLYLTHFDSIQCTVFIIILQLDVIVADLDGGGIMVPEHLNLPVVPEPIYSRTLNSLFLVHMLKLLKLKKMSTTAIKIYRHVRLIINLLQKRLTHFSLFYCYFSDFTPGTTVFRLRLSSYSCKASAYGDSR